MKTLNSKSILQCKNEEEETIHSEENNQIFEQINNSPNYNCTVTIKFIDEANKDRNPIRIKTRLHDIEKIIEESTDFTNGVDIFEDNGKLLFVVHGRFFTKDGIHGIEETHVEVVCTVL